MITTQLRKDQQLINLKNLGKTVELEQKCICGYDLKFHPGLIENG